MRFSHTVQHSKYYTSASEVESFNTGPETTNANAHLHFCAVPIMESIDNIIIAQSGGESQAIC